MNIAIVTTWFERGAAYVSKQYADTLAAQGHNISIYVRGGEEVDIDSHPWNQYRFQVDPTPRLPLPTGICKSTFTRFLIKQNIDLVLFNEQRYWQPVIWAKDLGCRVVAYIDYYTQDTLKFFDVYDAVICNTYRHFEAFRWHENCCFIKWGTDLKIYNIKYWRATVTQPFTFFHSCGYSPGRKGTELLIEAFAGMDCANCVLVIHTQVNLYRALPAQRCALENLVSSGRLRIVQGSITAPGLYGVGDVYVYPSKLDGLGLTVVEALASRMPVITTNAPPMNEFVDDQIGRLVAVEKRYRRADGYYWDMVNVSVGDLRAAMEEYVADKSKAVAQSQNIMERTRSELDWFLNSVHLGEFLAGINARPLTELRRKDLKGYDKSLLPFIEVLSPLYTCIFNALFWVKRKIPCDI